MNTLYETERLKIDHEAEATFLIDKSTGVTLIEDHFYGDPTCGLIDNDNQWAIVGGVHLIIWTPEKWERINDNELKWIYALRIKDPETVQILTDPWHRKSAIWEINTKTFDFEKVNEFKAYQDQQYSDNVAW